MPDSSAHVSVPDRLPNRITPCPIIEAVFEIRFVTSEPWTTLPGLLYAAIREHYDSKRDLPLAQFPEPVRSADPRLALQPLIRFEGQGPFAVVCGPRVVALATQPERYPGWGAIETELSWLVPKVLGSGIVHEPERLGVRYVDFFELDLFPRMRLGLAIDGGTVTEGDMTVAVTFSQWNPFAVRLAVSNNATMKGSDDRARRGSVLDADVGLGALDFDADEGAIRDRFRQAHRINKEAFFGLLRPEFLGTLSPEYSDDPTP